MDIYTLLYTPTAALRHVSPSFYTKHNLSSAAFYLGISARPGTSTTTLYAERKKRPQIGKQ